ncbi:hypothetical protein [Pendulispora albinea]|uniref:Keratin associated protein n=1 Tax=Pendulispora albinea TaxID=2741071 RepID=A0ABZ2MAY9_9BACT
MARSILRKASSLSFLVCGLAAPVLMNCGGGAPGAPGGLTSAIPGGAGGCPDLSSADAVAKVDFVNEFSVAAENAAKLKAGLQASAEIQAFAAKLDGDLKVACGGLAKDLGITGEFKSGEDSCKAAAEAIKGVKAKFGAKAKVAVDTTPPRCEASMNVVADCAAKCDASVTPGSAKVECEPGKLSGSCNAECSGTCEMKGAAKCDGTCSGSCEATFKGACGGACNGKCDGKDSKGGTCNGTCEGSCSANAKGTCGGKCNGSCELKAKAKCEGTCTGSCSVEMKEPKCTGEITPPKMSAECKAHCDAEVSGKLECKPAQVIVRVDGSADASAATAFKAALEKNLPAILTIAEGQAKQANKTAANVSVVIEGLQGSAQGMASGGLTAAAKLAGCVAAPFKGALDAAASVKANVKVSVDVKASASASGSASGKAG